MEGGGEREVEGEVEVGEGRGGGGVTEAITNTCIY